MNPHLYPVSGDIKREVINDNNEKLGILEQYMVDFETGKIMFGILAFRKFPFRTKFLAVPWELFKFSNSEGTLILNVPRSIVELESGKNKINQVCTKLDVRWLGGIYECYNKQPIWEETRAVERQEELERIRVKRERIDRCSMAYYWWRDCARRRIIGN